MLKAVCGVGQLLHRSVIAPSLYPLRLNIRWRAAQLVDLLIGPIIIRVTSPPNRATLLGGRLLITLGLGRLPGFQQSPAA